MTTLTEARFKLSWNLNDDLYGRRTIKNPSWLQIREKLELLYIQKFGTVCLDFGKNSPTEKEKILNIDGQEGYFRIIFFDVVNGKRIERETFDEAQPGGMKELPDEDWDERSIFRDFDFAYQVFKEFFETQSVSSPRIV